MGDHATSNDPAANAPDAATYGKGKGKATDPTNEMSMDEEDSESESEPELVSLSNFFPHFKAFNRFLVLTCAFPGAEWYVPSAYRPNCHRLRCFLA